MMKNISIWKDIENGKKYPTLKQDIDVDVLIVGGGITGVNCLYQLRNSGLRVALVEQNRIGMGVTSNSTGKLTYLQDSLSQKILQNFDFEKASLYLASQREAIRLAKDIIEKNSLDCDLVKTDSYVYTNKEEEVSKIKEMKDFLEKNGVEVFEDSVDLVESKYMIGVHDTYLFQPVRFVLSLLEKSKTDLVYEDVSVQKIEKEDECYVCYTDSYKIKTTWVVLASHYPYFKLPYFFPMKGSLEKSYISASLCKVDPISLISYKEPFVSIRNFQDYLLYLSNSHNISSDVDDEKHFSELLKKVHDLKLEPEYLWSNVDIMTNDGLPYIGEIKDKLIVATGYNTWGMTNGILAGKIVSDLILGVDNRYLALFDPNRVNVSNVLNSLADLYYSASGLVQGMFYKNSQIEYEEVDGKKVAIYRDEKGEHKVYTKCPHMGCSLIFNEVEKTWDCPCHASRFDLDGKCLSGPANQDISV